MSSVNAVYVSKHEAPGHRGHRGHLVSEGLELAGRAGVQVHELVSVHKQSRLFALVLVLEGGESSALHLEDTGQVSDVALEREETSPDLTAERGEGHQMMMMMAVCCLFALNKAKRRNFVTPTSLETSFLR